MCHMSGQTTTNGTAPADNPFYDGNGHNYDAIYATGFRNPFRLAFAPDPACQAELSPLVHSKST